MNIAFGVREREMLGLRHYSSSDVHLVAEVPSLWNLAYIQPGFTKLRVGIPFHHIPLWCVVYYMRVRVGTVRMSRCVFMFVRVVIPSFLAARQSGTPCNFKLCAPAGVKQEKGQNSTYFLFLHVAVRPPSGWVLSYQKTSASETENRN